MAFTSEDSIELKFQALFAALEAEVQILRSYRAYDVSQFAVTINKSDSATLTATWQSRFAKAQTSCSLSMFLDINSLFNRRPMTCHPAICHLRQVTFAASVHLILPITRPVITAMQSCASEIESYKTVMLAPFSDWSDLASNFFMTFSGNVRIKFSPLLVPTSMP
jgi:hypothetical protein